MFIGTTTRLSLSFYSNDDDDDEDEDDDDDYITNLDDSSVADFRDRMSSMFIGTSTTEDARARTPSTSPSSSPSSTMSPVDELIQFARKSSSSSTTSSSSSEVAAGSSLPSEWAYPTNQTVTPGTILLANPAFFCIDFDDTTSSFMDESDVNTNDAKADFWSLLQPPGSRQGASSNRRRSGRYQPDPRLLAKFGLTLPPPAELGPDRRADLLPVLMVVEHAPTSNTSSSSPPPTLAVLLNRRTGYLLGDLEQPNDENDNQRSSPILEKFCIQPLWFGGIDHVSSGLDMLHQCPTVSGAKPLTSDGLYWGGDPGQAQEAMAQTLTTDSRSGRPRPLTGFDFKFFVQSTVWNHPQELERDVAQGIWFAAKVSKDVLFKSRDRMGTRRAKVRTFVSKYSNA